MSRNSRTGLGGFGSSPFVSLSPVPVITNRLPTTLDFEYEVGTLWINRTTNQAWHLTSSAGGAANWSLASPGASDVDTINGLSPVLGNIIIDGGTNITDVNAGNTVTLNLDAAITLATSVTSPLYTSGAGVDTSITAPAGQDIVIQMGDAAGANIVEFEDSASATVASIDSNGTATFVGMDGILGAVTPAAITGTTITANTSVTSPLYTAAAADALIQAGGANDVVLRLGDAAGATFLRVQSSTPADVFTIDSLGAFSVIAGLTVAGAFAQTGGTFNVGQDNAANAINIGGGNVARAIGLANSAAAHTLTIGNAALGAITVDTAAGVSIDAATASNFTVTGAGADLNLQSVGGSIDLTASEAAVDAIDIQATNAGGGINMDCGTAGFDLLSTGGGFSIDGQSTSNITVTSAGLDLSLQGVGCAVNITSTQTENDAINIEASAVNGGVVINAGTGGIRIGDEVDCTGLTFGNIAPTASRNITIGSGTIVTAAVTDDISIGDGGATTNVNSIKHVDINNGGVTLGEVNTYMACGAVTSGTHLTEIATGNRAAGSMNLNVLTGTGIKTLGIGNADGLTNINVRGALSVNNNVNASFAVNDGTSTGTITLGAIANSGAVTIESSATIDVDAAGTVSINSTGAAINIGNDDIDQAVNVGSDGERVVTVGSTNGAASLVLQAGTGEITVTGTVKQIDAELMGATGVYIPTINMSPIMQTAATTGGVPTGATGDVNLMSLQNQIIMEQFILGAGQTIIAPRMSANGLLISLDLTATEGAEYNFGGALDSTFGFTVGASGAFFFELDLYINDMDGADPYIFGFRKTEANNATFANYTDYYALGMNAATSITNIVIFDELNATGQTITDTTDLWGGDGSTNTLRIDVSAAGVCTSYINGVIASAAPAFTFDADRVTPFIRLTHSASPTQVAITGIRIGLQA